MRRILVVLAVLAAIFTAYWFTVARGVDAGLRAWFAAREADGWVADYATLGTTGFPGRFDTVVMDLSLADPRTGVAWTAPRFAFEAAAFKPHRITARWPGTQTVASPWERIAVTSDEFDASIEFVPGTRLELRAVEANLAGVTLDSSLGWQSSFAVGALSAALLDGQPQAIGCSFGPRISGCRTRCGEASTPRGSCRRSSKG
jgi:hypothetical protein